MHFQKCTLSAGPSIPGRGGAAVAPAAAVGDSEAVSEAPPEAAAPHQESKLYGELPECRAELDAALVLRKCTPIEQYR